MALILKDYYKTHLAERIYSDALQNVTRYHYFLGRTTDWPASTINQGGGSEETQTFEMVSRRNLLFTRLIAANNLALTCRREDWVSGTVYDQYDDNYSDTLTASSGATRLADSKFYILTSNNEVYKCISNNNGAQSTVEPNTPVTGMIDTADGYVWRYMYTIPDSTMLKFGSTARMPVFTDLSSKFYSNGSIESFIINDGGSGYTTATVTITGDGDGNAAGTANLNGGVIESITVDNPGQGYTFAIVTITGDGTGADVSAQLTVNDLNTQQSNVEITAVNGALSNIVVDNGGTGYSVSTELTITGDGTGATATPVVVAGVITGINITNYGSNYTYANITASNEGTGFSARVILSPVGGHGRNAPRELFADGIAFYNVFDNATSLVDLALDYRQVGIISNIEDFGSANRSLFGGDLGIAAHQVTGSQIVAANHSVGHIVANGQDRFEIIAIEDGNAIVKQIDNSNLYTGTTYTNETNANSIIFDTTTVPTVNFRTGEIMYIDSQEVAFDVNAQQYLVLRTNIVF